MANLQLTESSPYFNPVYISVFDRFSNRNGTVSSEERSSINNVIIKR